MSGGARTLHGVGAHFDYIGRQGPERNRNRYRREADGKRIEKDLMLEWDLDLYVLSLPFRSIGCERP